MLCQESLDYLLAPSSPFSTCSMEWTWFLKHLFLMGSTVRLHQQRELEGPCRRASLFPAAVFRVFLPLAAPSLSSMGV